MKGPESFFRTLLALALPVPRFRFNKDLYDQLCREKKSGGEAIDAPNSQPEVSFEMGPIDGVLGQCDMRTGRITIDVLEHFLFCLHTGQNLTVEQLRQKFDDRLTNTLAHEGGHWHLDKRYGAWPKFEKFSISTLLIVLGLILGVLLIASYSRLIIGHLVPAMWVIHPIIGVLGLILTLLIYFWLTMRIMPIYISFCMAMSAIMTYKICWHERHARKFEKRVKSDSRWKGVVELD